MPPLLDRIRRLAAETTERAAAGSAMPAGMDPDTAEQAQKPRVRERGSMRRRLRDLRRRREALLAELGAVVYELKRQGREETDVVSRQVEELGSVDDEARALEAALNDGAHLDEVLREGISGACEHCGALMGTDDNFCARCGTAAPAGGDPPPVPAAKEDPPPAPTTAEAPASATEEKLPHTPVAEDQKESPKGEEPDA